MKATIPIGIPSGTKLLHLEWCEENKHVKCASCQGWMDEYGHPISNESYYVLWIHHDKTMQYGTYLKLYSTGQIDRITIGPDGCETIYRVK